MKTPLTALRFVAWACLIGIAVVSWTPNWRPEHALFFRTGFNTRLEHVAAYLTTGIAVINAYPRSPTWTMVAVLCGYAGILELGQIYVPGRHAAFLDWLASCSGVLCAWLTVAFGSYCVGHLHRGGDGNAAS